ncbi:MAG: hypothetical protein WCH34_00495 [Bacteroidota bacterium]
MEILLQEFISKTLEEINEGLPGGYIIEGTIDFEVSLTTSTNKSGKVEIKVISGGLEKGNELVQNVYFSVINELEKKRSEKNSADTIFKYIEKGLKKINTISEKSGKVKTTKNRN